MKTKAFIPGWLVLGLLASSLLAAPAKQLWTQKLPGDANVEDGTQKGPGLLKIDLATGEPRGQLLLNDKEPDYRVDEAVGRVFYFKGKNSIVAYQF